MAMKKILIVDDEEAMLDVLEKKLKTDRYQVLRATRADEALEQIRKELPDLVLMDIILPDEEGSDVVKTLQAHGL